MIWQTVRRPLGLALALVAGLGAAAWAQSVSIEQPLTASTVVGPDVEVRWSAQGLQVAAADGQQVPGVGHFHLILLDGADATLDLAPGQPIGRSDRMVHTTETRHTFTGLNPGDYTLYLVVGDGLHVPTEPLISAVAHFTVVTLAFLEPAEGATVWGNIVRARWLSEGVSIQDADGQRVEGVAHYHLILVGRRDAKLALPAGEPIGQGERSVHTTGSAHVFESVRPGPDTLFLVLGDGQHVPGNPPAYKAVHFNVVPPDPEGAIQETPWWLVGLLLGAIVGAALLLQS